MDTSMHDALLLSETEIEAETHNERPITTSQPGTQFSPTPIVEQTDRKETADLAWMFGILSCFCCNILLGIGAIYFANEATNFFNERKIVSGISLRKWSYFFSFLAFLTGVGTIVFVVIHFVL
ncbi:uncharacterized protein LOC134230437 [Saccostrea cucullata]|uniref:uncharacterized protein LOC134230437 n=1 Tax=Saccostrea cuccullata TaxID=36930 RepID=UPI002ED6BE7C